MVTHEIPVEDLRGDPRRQPTESNRSYQARLTRTYDGHRADQAKLRRAHADLNGVPA